MSATRIIGADVGGTAVKYVVVDAAGEIVSRGEVATDPASPDATLATLAADVDVGGELAGVGLACAGIVDPDAGTLGRAPNLRGWEGSDLDGAVVRAFGEVPVALANDVNAALAGEWRLGAGRGARDLVMLALGTGVGGGVLVNERIVVGSRCGAGEIGHVVVDPDGPVCGCGNRGCLEAFAGARGLATAARRLAEDGQDDPELTVLCAGDDGPTPRRLADLAAAGNGAARDIFANAGRMLGVAVGGLINILDPDLVIVGGGVARAGDLILEPCRRTASRIVLCEAAKGTPVVAAELGHRAAALGAAVLVRDRIAGG